MNGCELPVIINSGSGNQGMTSSIPVIEYAKEFDADEDTLYRALALSNLVTIHQRPESDVFLHTVEQSAQEQEQVRELHISVEEVMKK